MSTLKIHSKNKISSTVIPNCFFDTYMLYANGEFLKVYLYFYRWHNVPDHELSIASVADTLNMTESDVIRALKYWERESLLSLDTDTSGTQIFGITFNPILPRSRPVLLRLRNPLYGLMYLQILKSLPIQCRISAVFPLKTMAISFSLSSVSISADRSHRLI